MIIHEGCIGVAVDDVGAFLGRHVALEGAVGIDKACAVGLRICVACRCLSYEVVRAYFDGDLVSREGSAQVDVDVLDGGIEPVAIDFAVERIGDVLQLGAVRPE